MTTLTNLKDWYQSELGKALLEDELKGLASVLPDMFGYYIAQIGGPTTTGKVLSSSKIHNHIYVNPETPLTTNALAVRCKLDELPFLPESIDVIVMLHVLEFASDPKIIIKEVYDVLIQGGYLIILGFNPYSLWGMTKLFSNSKEHIFNGKWISPGNLRHSLHKVGFEVQDYQTFYFRPASPKAKKMTFIEALGEIFWPYCGASYMTIAQKTSILVTPLLNNIKSFIKPVGLAKGLPKPNTSRVTQ